MSANAEIIAELRRVLNERDEARKQLDLTKRELGRWVDRETKAARELDEARERNTDLRKMLEQVTRERDVEATSALMFECDWKDACRLRKLFDDAGEGQYNVLNLVESYQRNSMEADERLRAVRKLLEWNGCECECEHHWEDHDDDCDRCLACRIGEAVGK